MFRKSVFEGNSIFEPWVERVALTRGPKEEVFFHVILI
jgi:hypothetical protein